MAYQKAFALLGIVAASGLSALAAPPETEQPTTKKPNEVSTTTAVKERTSWHDSDHILASCIAIDNQEEVAIAKWAEPKLQNEEAKKFAQMIAKDHSELLTQLEKFAPEATRDEFLTQTTTTPGADGTADADRNTRREDRQERRRERAENRAEKKAADAADPDNKPDQDPENENNQDEQQARRGTNPPGENRPIQQVSATTELTTEKSASLDPLQFHRELAEQCLADTKEMLSQKSEQEIDQCFVGLQVAKHAAMKTKLEVSQRHASGELKEIFAKAAQTTQRHLEHAEKLMKQLDKPDSSTARTN